MQGLRDAARSIAQAKGTSHLFILLAREALALLLRFSLLCSPTESRNATQGQIHVMRQHALS
jgi:hypothetical protein